MHFYDARINQINVQKVLKVKKVCMLQSLCCIFSRFFDVIMTSCRRIPQVDLQHGWRY